MRSARYSFTLLLIASLALVACSPFGDDDDGDEAATQTPAAMESPAATEPAEEAEDTPVETPEATSEGTAEGPAEGTPEGTPAGPSAGTPEGTPPSEEELRQQGATIFANICSSCHGPEAQGNGPIPALAGNGFVTLQSPEPVARVVLTGRGGMPRFSDDFSSEQIAAVLTYIRSSFGNEASPVTPSTVQQIREDLGEVQDVGGPGGQGDEEEEGGG